MTDKEKIIDILNILAIPYDTKSNWLYFSGRRLTFNAQGEVVKVRDYVPPTAKKGGVGDA